MKKLMTILAAFLCVSILLVSCGNEDDNKKKEVITPESEAKKMVNECYCSMIELSEKISKSMQDEGEMEKLQKEAEVLGEKCEKMGKTLEDKYGDMMSQKDDEDSKKFWETMEAEMEKCE